jgi:hypothetical protein
MKKGLCTKLTASITLALAAAAYAQPANDTCSGAFTMVDGVNNFDNTGATQDTTISCAFGGAGNSGLDVWYTYTATSTGTVDFTVTSYATGDSTLAIYDACGGTELACNDDAIGLLSQILAFPVTNGTTYKIRLSGWGAPGGQGAGVLNIGAPPPPSGNDTCAGATVVTDGAFTAATGSTTEVTPGCGFGGQFDSWYSYTATGSGVLTVNMCAGASFDTILSAYDACGGTQIACNDDFCGLQSQITFPITAGTTYKIALSGYNGQSGSGTITFSSQTGGPPANDVCSAAATVTPGTALAFDNTLATTDGAPGSCNVGGSLDGNDLWFDYTATLTGVADIEVLDTFGLGDSTLQVYDVCNGTELACDDDGGFGLLSRLGGFAVTSGTNYKIRVAGWGTVPDIGAAELLVTERVPTAFDDCSLATPVAGTVIVPFDTNGLTTDGTGCGGTTDGWYAWTPSASGLGVVTTCGLTGDDTTLSAYDSCGGVALDCVDDACGLQSTISFPVLSGNTYLVRLASFSGLGMTGSVSFDVPPPPANDVCGGAIAASLGATNYDSTVATSDGNFATCAFGGTPDNADVWFSYTAGTESFITVDTFGGGIFDTTLAIYDACGGTEVACNDDAGGGLQSQICNFPVTTGTTYFIRVASWGAAGAGGPGLINIATSLGGTPFNPPSGAITEPEVCGTFPDVDNGGCNSTPEAYTAAALCDTFVGTGYFDGSFRDTDWYQFTIDTDDTVTMSGQTQFAGLFGILQVSCPSASFLAFTLPDPTCDNNFSVTATLTAGTYVAFAAPQFTNIFTCGSNDQYWFSLTGTGECNNLVCNDIDVNNDGSFFDPTDIDAFLSVFSEGPCIPASQTCDGIDFNNDTSLFDPCDIDAFLLVFSEGPCTLCGV